MVFLSGLADSARQRPDRWCVMVIICLPVVLFFRALLPGNILSPADIMTHFYPWTAARGAVPNANFNFGDVALVFHPWLVYASRALADGRLPLWNPHAFAGAPFLGNMQSALLSPFTVPAYLVPLKYALALAAMLKPVVAGLSTYWFLRLLSLRPLSSLMGAVAFMFNGFIIVWLQFSLGSVAVWMPLLFALAERLRQTGALRWLGCLSIVVGVQCFGGHPETSFHVLLATSAYVLFRGVRGKDAGFVVRYTCALLLGLAVAAIQLVPFVEYLRDSSILAYRTDRAVVVSVSYKQVLQLLAPAASYGPNEAAGAVGVMPWVLLPCALLGAFRRTEAFFFLFVAMGCAAVVYGNPAVLQVLATLPGFSLVANHRLILVLAFCLAVLSAMGMEMVLRPPPKKGRTLAVGTVLFAGVLVVCVLTLKGLTNWVSCVDVSSDGKFMATGHWNFLVRLWDTETVRTLHSRTVPSAPAVRRALPSRRKATTRTGPLCPSKILTTRPEETSDSFATPSSPAVAMSVPSGLYAARHTIPAWHRRTFSSAPVRTFHKRVEPSSPTVARLFPSGLKVTEFTSIVCP